MQVVQVVEVPFHGDIIEGALVGGRPMVKMNRLCENLGIDAYKLRERLGREGVVTVTMTVAVDAKGELRTTYFVDVKDIAYVVTTIDVIEAQLLRCRPQNDGVATVVVTSTLAASASRNRWGPPVSLEEKK